MIEKDYISSAKKQFAYYKSLGDKSFEQLDDEDLFYQLNNQSNSIAIIVNHIAGNMLSRWTDFLTTDGEKEFRNRDQEFENIINTRVELLEKWEQGWAVLFNAIEQLSEENMNTIIYIRNQGHSIVEAVNRQLCHYSYHIGQIVFLAKQRKKDGTFVSLSIPKGASTEYNKEKFSKEKSRQHFTDEMLDESK